MTQPTNNMKNKSLWIAGLALAASASAAFATNTYTTLTGSVDLVAGLTNLSSSTAIGSTNQSVGINFITDDTWLTGIANLGGAVDINNFQTANNGTLAGTFGGANYFSSSNQIILIGNYGGSSGWGSWSARLLLSNDTYTTAQNYTDANMVLNPTVTIPASSSMFVNPNGATNSLPVALKTSYIILDISSFDTGNIGVKGIELLNMTTGFPDIQYIGVIGSAAAAVPEPSSLALVAAGCGALVLRRRRK